MALSIHITRQAIDVWYNRSTACTRYQLFTYGTNAASYTWFLEKPDKQRTHSRHSFSDPSCVMGSSSAFITPVSQAIGSDTLFCQCELNGARSLRYVHYVDLRLVSLHAWRQW